MPRLSSLIQLAFVVAALASPGSASAQTYFQPIDFLPANTQLWTLDTVGGHDSAEDAVEARARLQGIEPSGISSAELIRKLTSLADFRPSASLRQANVRTFLDRVRAASPETAAGLEQQLQDGAVFAMIDQSVAPYGMSTRNVADAFAIWWINGWEASQGILNSQNDPETIAAVRRQALLAIMATPNFVSASDARKQQMADEYVLNASLISASMAYLAQNRDQLPAYSKAIAQTTRAAGLDFDSMMLTRQGFVQKAR